MRKLFFVLSIVFIPTLAMAGAQGTYTILQDHFTDTDNTLLINHTPDVNLTGDVYHNMPYAHDPGYISGNRLTYEYSTSYTYANNYIDLSINSTSYIMYGAYNMKFPSTNGGIASYGPRVFIRGEATGTSNTGYYIQAILNYPSVGNLSVYFAGTTLNADYAISPIVTIQSSALYTNYVSIGWSDNGDSITSYANYNSLSPSTPFYTYNTTLHNTNTLIHFKEGAADNHYIMDNLLITYDYQATATPTSTLTISETPTYTETLTPTPTPTYTDTLTPSPTPTSTNTESPTPTYTNTESPTPTYTNTESPTPTYTNTATMTNTETETPTISATYTITATFTITPTPGRHGNKLIPLFF